MKMIAHSLIVATCCFGIGISPVHAADKSNTFGPDAGVGTLSVESLDSTTQDRWSIQLEALSRDFAVVYRCLGPKPIMARVADGFLPGDAWRVTVNKTIGLGVDTESNQAPPVGDPHVVFDPDVFSPYAQNAVDGATLVTVTAANEIPAGIPAGLFLEIENPDGKSLNCIFESIEGGVVISVSEPE